MRIVQVFIATLIAVAIVAAALSPISSVDIFWHLKVGLDFLKNNLSPFVDHYSLYFAGQQIMKSPYWLFQTLVAFLFDNWGENGLFLFRLVAWMIPFGILIYFCRRKKIAFLSSVILLITFATIITHRRLIRPEILSYSLTLFMCSAYLFQGMGKKFFLLLAAILLFWSNWHISSFMGYVLLICFVIEDLASNKPMGHRYRILGIGTLLLFVGFINPTQSHSLLVIASMVGAKGFEIQESAGLSIETSPFIYYIYYIFLVFSLLYYMTRKNYGISLLLFLFSAAPLASAKLMPHSMMATILFVGIALNDSVESKSAKNKLHLKLLFAGLGLAMALGLIGYTFLGNKRFTPKFSYEDVPQDLATFLNKRNEVGEVFNEYGFGGYLLMYHYPKVKPYIDGRINILYPIDYFNEYIDITGNPGLLKKALVEKDIKHVISRIDQTYPLFSSALGVEELNLIYVGEKSAFFSNEGQFSGITQVLRDFSQIDNLDPEQLEREIIAAQTSWGKGLGSWLSFTRNFIKITNPNAVLEMAVNSGNYFILRSMAQFKFNKGQFKESAELFKAIDSLLNYDDRLMLIEALCQSFDCNYANQQFLRLGRQRKSPRYKGILKKWFETILSNQGSKAFSELQQKKIVEFIEGP